MSWKIYPVTVHTTLCLSNSVWEKKNSNSQKPTPQKPTHTAKVSQTIWFIFTALHIKLYSVMTWMKGENLFTPSFCESLQWDLIIYIVWSCWMKYTTWKRYAVIRK